MANFNCYICESDTGIKKGILGSAAATIEVCDNCNSSLDSIIDKIKSIPNRKLPFNKSGNIFNNKKKDEEALWRCAVELKRRLSDNEEIIDFLSIDNGTFAITAGMLVLTNKKFIGFTFTTSGATGVKPRQLSIDINASLDDIVNLKIENSLAGDKIVLQSKSGELEKEKAFQKIYSPDRNGSPHFQASLVKQKSEAGKEVAPETKSNDGLENLKKLKDLLDAGIISQEDFDKKKEEILKNL